MKGIPPGGKVHVNAVVVFMNMARNRQLTEPLQDRVKKGSKISGRVRPEEFDWHQTIADRES